MSDLNQCTFTGRLGADPEIRYTTEGKPVANLQLACGEKWTDKNGEKKEETEWVRVVAFGKLAEIIEKYPKKGAQLLIVGKMKTRKWEDNEGRTRYTTEIVAREMNMLGSKGDNEAPRQQPETSPQDDDDIPFN